MMYDRITEGQDFIPSAKRENAVNDLLNQFTAPGGVPDRNTYSARLVTAPVKLVHADSVNTGELIGFLYTGEDYAESIAPADWKTTGARLGIVRGLLRKNEIADVAALGAVPASVMIISAGHGYAKPDQDGKLVSCSEVTQFQILTGAGNLRAGERQTCQVFIGTPPPEPEEYSGPFKVTLSDDGKKIDVAGGFLNRNGMLVKVPKQKKLDWKAGYLCVHSEIKGASWTGPEFRIVAEPSATHYPVAYLSGSDEAKYIEQYHVPMAIIILSKACPVAEA